VSVADPTIYGVEASAKITKEWRKSLASRYGTQSLVHYPSCTLLERVKFDSLTFWLTISHNSLLTDPNGRTSSICRLYFVIPPAE
jgi:hypothetical protein